MKEEILQEMYSDWLWKKYDNELYNEALKQVEKEQGFWRSVFGVRQKILDRQWELFEELKKQLDNGEEND